jgi:hypothetical protein
MNRIEPPNKGNHEVLLSSSQSGLVTGAAGVTLNSGDGLRRRGKGRGIDFTGGGEVTGGKEPTTGVSFIFSGGFSIV